MWLKIEKSDLTDNPTLCPESWELTIIKGGQPPAVIYWLKISKISKLKLLSKLTIRHKNYVTDVVLFLLFYC